MEPWEVVDSYFCKICEIPEEELNPESHSLVQVWHSFGLIQNGGFHSYLCTVGDEALKVAEHYRSIGSEAGAGLIEQLAQLWRQYRSPHSPDESDPDSFRELFDSELDDIEEKFYDLEESLIDALFPIAERGTHTNG